MSEFLSPLLELVSATPALFIALVFVFSLLVGSFLNVVIHRVPIMLERQWRAEATELLGETTVSDPKGKCGAHVPEKYNLVVPRSACPQCGAQITALQNIPVVSYLVLGGKCANCRARISPRYPIVEMITALLSALVAWKFGVTWFTAAALVLTWVLVALTFIDFDTQLLPDNMTLPLMWLGVLVSLAAVNGAAGLPVDLRSSVLGAVAGYLSLWTVYHLFKLLTGKEGMGYGDFKLFAALGAWLGWQMLPLVILLSAFTGAVVGIVLIVARGRDKNIPIPFGPYLAAAGWTALMWGDSIVSTYLRASGIG
jgi:leader peptidase (prepilin peptidase)/N-methyltransferase